MEFSKGNLKPGLIVRKTPLKTYTNNVVSRVHALVLRERERESQRDLGKGSAGRGGGGHGD